tara:strand:- start:282 stop:1004 length:723 start_codon:yes stop_codon:yes gene_type:complete
MYNNKVYLLLIIIFLIIVLINSLNKNKDTFINYGDTLRLPNSVLNNFQKNHFNKKKYDVVVLKYIKDSLDPVEYINMKLNDFINKTENTEKFRYQIKQKFNNNDLSKYLLKNAYYPTIKYLKLNETNVEPGYIRISNTNWFFDYHFDCINIILVQLVGTRILYLKNDINDKKFTKHILRPGSVFYIEMGVYHKIETKSELNVNFTIIAKEVNKKKINNCKEKFKNVYKIQNKKCIYNDCV